jgi:hypothetical protein
LPPPRPTHVDVAGRRRIALVSALLAALALAAAAAAGTWPKVEKNAADQALAKRSILHLSDFTPGTGWSAAPDSGGGSGSTGGPSSCNGPAFSDQGRVLTGSASSSFQATGLQVWSSADVMQTLAMARHDASQTSSAAVTPCLTALFKKDLPSSAKLVSVRKLGFPRVGDWTTAYRALIDVAVNGTNVRLQFDMVLVLHSRVEITLMQMAPAAISKIALEGEVRLAQRLAGSGLSA